MAKRLVRIETVQEGDIQYPLQVLWGAHGTDGRPVLITDPKGMGIRDFLDNHPSKNLDERMKLDAGIYKLVTYTADNPLSAKEFVEIMQRTARLQGRDIVTTDATLIEQDI